MHFAGFAAARLRRRNIFVGMIFREVFEGGFLLCKTKCFKCRQRIYFEIADLRPERGFAFQSKNKGINVTSKCYVFPA